ncbi:alpha/beta fold hydrolase [Sphingomonas sp. TZW2008]|uniref:alpha/beta fold hydrolase n=1 Tax=Sphingomonas sp. TZW2008 TaxID=1917973 RepID=UPI000A26E37B|nr:alpha/beta hydrolase [Sphingomonas sp. TZW2008]
MTDPAPIRRAIPADATVTCWAAPDGWQLRRFDWPAAGGAMRGGILFQGGRGDVFEKYLESFGHWHGQGWTIAAFDWRGQGGSGRLSPDPHVGHATDFAPWIADLAAFWRDWDVAGPRVAMGHSMGGHLVLRALLEAAIDPVAAVLIAPMLGLKSPVGAGVAERVARLMRRIGDPARPAWKGHERPGARLDRRTLLTADHSRYDDEQYWYEAVPEIKLGPPSWAWLAEAFASTRAQRADPRLATIKTPLLMLIADADGLVDSRAAVALAARLPTAQVIRFGRESAHEILREADPVRDRALAAIDGFLTAHGR